MNYLLPKNWSKFSRRYSGNEEELRKYKRVILLSQFTLFGTVICFLHAVEDLFDGLVFMPVMDSILALAIFAGYLLNENGRHKIARIFLLSFLNLFFFVYSSLAHPDLGIYLFYFTWVGLAAVVFESSENIYRFFFIGLSIGLTILLFATSFNLFGEYSFGATALHRSFILNFVTSISALVFFIVFMISMNEHSEKKLLQLANEVKEKNQDLEKVNRELDRFFYSASHDLKVPLLDIKGAIQSARLDFADDERALSYFDVLKQRADKMEYLLQEVIDYARNTQTELRTESVNILQLVDNVVDNFTFVRGADKIRFIRDVNLNYLVEADRLRLVIILNNIVSNAIKYHNLQQSDPWIKVSVTHKNGFLHVSVEDNGQGMEEDVLPKIFNMFFRGTSESKGSGLGLYIVKETLDKMGGVIEARSKPGKGSTFHFSIPVTLLKTIPGNMKPVLS